MADGAIRIITKIGTEGFEQGRKRLEHGMKKLGDSMKHLANSTFGVGNAANKAFESARLKAQDTEIAIAEIEKKMQSVREAAQDVGAEGSKAFQKAKTKADELNRSLSELNAERDAMAQSKLAQAVPSGMRLSDLTDDFIGKTLSKDSGIKAIDKQISKTEARLAEYRARMQEAKASGSGLTDEAERELKSLQKKLDGLNIRLLQYRQRMEDAKSGTSGFSQVTDRVKKSFQGLFGESKKVEKQTGRTGTMIERMISRMLIFAAIALVMKSVSEGIQNIAQASESANTVLSNLSTNFLYLKNSIATAVIPILEALAPMIMFITDNLTALFNMVGMVTARLFGGETTFVKAKKAQTDYAESLDKTGKAAKKAAKALAAFDQINILQQKEDTTPGMPDPKDMFEEVEIPEETLAFVDKISELFERLKETAQPAVDALKNGLEKIDWQKINAALQRLWEALRPFAVKVGEGLLWLWERVLVPLGTWTISNLLPAFLGLLSAALKALNIVIDILKPGALWLWNEWLKPLAQWTGETIIRAINLLTDAFNGFSDWAKKNPETVRHMGEIILEFLAGIWIYNTAKNIIVFIAGLRAALLGLSGTITIAGAGAALAAIGFAALFVAIIELIKHWDEMNGIERTVSILGAIAAAAAVAAAAVGALHSAWSFGIAAAAIVAGIAAISIAISSAKKRAESEFSSIQSPSIKATGIPRLATGTVIPPNREFTAILGDQKSGTNVEAPLSTIEQALENVWRRMGGTGGDGDIVINNGIELDGEVIFNNQQRIARRRGARLLNGVSG